MPINSGAPTRRDFAVLQLLASTPKQKIRVEPKLGDTSIPTVEAVPTSELIHLCTTRLRLYADYPLSCIFGLRNMDLVDTSEEKLGIRGIFGANPRKMIWITDLGERALRTYDPATLAGSAGMPTREEATGSDVGRAVKHYAETFGAHRNLDQGAVAWASLLLDPDIKQEIEASVIGRPTTEGYVSASEVAARKLASGEQRDPVAAGFGVTFDREKVRLRRAVVEQSRRFGQRPPPPDEAWLDDPVRAKGLGLGPSPWG